MNFLRVASLALCLSAACASAQTPIDPESASTKNPNPADSSDEEGFNPLARVGEHSPTGWNSHLDATVGVRSNELDGRAPENKDRTVTVVPPEHGIPQHNLGGRPIQQSDGGGTGVPDTR